MLDAPGVGLAAPQIGVGLRVFTYHVDDELGHLINPSLELSAEEETDDEGCLSFPGLTYPVKRAFSVVARGFNMHGEPVTLTGSGHLARCVQHETDHLDGVLFVDRLSVLKRQFLKKQLEALARGEVPEGHHPPAAGGTR
jgi:peptide deformylase